MSLTNFCVVLHKSLIHKYFRHPMEIQLLEYHNDVNLEDLILRYVPLKYSVMFATKISWAVV